MDIGVPTEIKPMEGRVSLIPAACAVLVAQGHRVIVQQGAGLQSGYTDQQYLDAGVELVSGPNEVFDRASLIVKVKEPIQEDLALLSEEHLLFSYLHLAANAELTRRLMDIGLTAIGFETVVGRFGDLPLLAPMSDIAGRLAVQIGTHLLHASQGGKGLLLGGLPAAPRGKVVILGAGVAGGNAALVAAGLGAQVVVFDKQREKLAEMRALGGQVTGLYPYQDSIDEQVADADLLIGAVLIPGAKAPHLVSAAVIKQMEAGSVVIDIAVDQGGCIETTKPTSYMDPTFVYEGVTHFGVTNMPGAVPRSASQVLSAAIVPYVEILANGELDQHAALSAGINVRAGKVVHPAL